MSNKKSTSKPVASLAAKVLQDNQASETAKSLAASALSQVNKGHETSKQMETLASKVLQSEKYSDASKTLAASVVSQSNKKP